jgi:hypothetical protein
MWTDIFFPIPVQRTKTALTFKSGYILHRRPERLISTVIAPTEVRITQLQISRGFEKNVLTVLKRVELLLVIMKSQRGEDGGRLLLGDNTGGKAVMRAPVKFQCVV